MTDSPVDCSDVSGAACLSQVSEAFSSARAAQRRWAGLSVQQRARVVRGVGAAVLDHRDELVEVICRETGKTRADAFAEVMDVATTAEFYGRRGRKVLAGRRVAGALPVLTRARVDYVPVGVVGIISPWNYPLSLVVSDALPALVAGNAVVLKPDTQVEETARLAVRILVDAGVDPELFQLVCGPGETVGQQVAAQCDFLMFTGSTATGRLLASQAGERLIGFSGELGGKNPMIVDTSASLVRAARGAVDACFSNAGQLCVAVERIVVVEDAEHPGRLEQFCALFAEAIAARGDVGIQISREHADRVKEFIDDAVDRGATVVTGGTVEGRLVAPTVLTGVDESARLYREEVFGPVAYVCAAGCVEEAIEWANDTNYGLNASVWASPRRGEEIASRLQAGTVNVNEGYAAGWASLGGTMGGMKASGMGRRHGEQGLLKFTEPRTVATQRVLPIGWLTWHPKIATVALRIMAKVPFVH
ncbi:succinic semialdehyde dehydrogenase [Corynebacterium aquilae]|uniref:succinic semialdehyde dehydrogenase n=1 Tax=Corynebacterium aquilae TaxID=203263 RepID=UPI001473B2D0|nr:succinic semialdehyde dehydrogenase [Corynebacterium aquilae]